MFSAVQEHVRSLPLNKKRDAFLPSQRYGKNQPFKTRDLDKVLSMLERLCDDLASGMRWVTPYTTTKQARASNISAHKLTLPTSSSSAWLCNIPSFCRPSFCREIGIGVVMSSTCQTACKCGFLTDIPESSEGSPREAT